MSGENLEYDEASMRAEIARLNVDIDLIPEKAPDDIPPGTFARAPSAVDYYTGLVKAWKNAEDTIEITPSSISQVVKGTKLPSSNTPQKARSYPEDDRYYVEEETSYQELEEKVDATYDKLCSLEQTDADMVDGMYHISKCLDDLYRKVKSVDELRNEVAALQANQKIIMETLHDIRIRVTEMHQKLC